MMYRLDGTETVAPGRMAAYQAWWEARDKLLRDRGLPPGRWYLVIGRHQNMVFYEGPEVETWEEGLQHMAQLGATEELQELTRQREEQGVVIPGSTQDYLLADVLP